MWCPATDMARLLCTSSGGESGVGEGVSAPFVVSTLSSAGTCVSCIHDLETGIRIERGKSEEKKGWER